MRGRAIGLGLLGLGAFLLAGALAVRLFLEPALVKLPLDQKASPTGDGTDISFFDLAAGKQLQGLDAHVEQRAAGDAGSADANSDVAVWNFGSTVTATGGDLDGTLLNAYTYRVCLDRRTAVAVDCGSDMIDYKDDVPVKGLTMTFPFGTEKKSYDYFNPTTKKAWPAKFEGTEKLDGLDVYRFLVSIPETVISQASVPKDRAAAMLGSASATDVNADVVYSNERTLWVEPTSGVIVTSEEHPNTFLRGPDGTQGATILAGTFVGTDKTIADGVKRAKDTAGQITMVSVTLPLLLAGLGLISLIVGALLIRRGRGGVDREEYSPEDIPVREPQVQ